MSGNLLLQQGLLLFSGFLSASFGVHPVESASCTVLPSISQERTAFIQPSYWKVQKYTQQDWRRMITDMKNMGVTGIIYQWTQTEGNQYSQGQALISDTNGSLDLKKNIANLKIISTLARSKGIRLSVGTYLPKDWWTAGSREQKFSEYLSGNLLVAQAIQKSGICFDSWYIPTEIAISEMDDRDSGGRLLYAPFFSQMVRDLKDKVNRPVFFSPFITKNEYTPTAAQAGIYALTPQEQEKWVHFVNQSGFDALLVQDGVGAQDVPAEFAVRYISALQQFIQTSPQITRRIPVYANMEIFSPTGLPDPLFQVAKIPQIRVQICGYLKSYPDKIAFFDYSHYADRRYNRPSYDLLKSFFVSNANLARLCQ